MSSNRALTGANSLRRAHRVAFAVTAVGLAAAASLLTSGSADALLPTPPTINSVSANPDPAQVNEDVTFTVSATQDDGEAPGETTLPGGDITRYDWDLDGNGSFETPSDPLTAAEQSEAYSTPGNKTVSVQVTDDDGHTATDSVTFTVNAPPAAGFIFEPGTPDVGETVTFSSTSTDAEDDPIPGANHKWDLDGDGILGEDTAEIDEVGRTVTHAFGTADNHQVQLEVTDTDGATDELTRTVSVGSTQPVPQPGEPNPQPGPPNADNRSPDASFRVSPRSPTAGEEVDLISTSSDPDGSIASYQWDLDSDGQFDDGAGAVITRVFPKGEVEVGLRVVDSQGAADVATRTVTIERKSASVLSPFPVVRLAGTLMASGKTKIKKLTVKAPKGAEVDVRCKGKSCPFAHEERSAKSARVKFPQIERVLKPGVVIKVFVSKPGNIGKFTRFKLRDGKPPKRTDRCLAQNGRKPIPCPTS